MLEKALSYNNWIPYQRLNWLELLPYALRMMQRTNVNTHSILCIPKFKKKKQKNKKHRSHQNEHNQICGVVG